MLSVSGGGSFGSGYDTTAAPTGGLIIEGNVGIGTTSPQGLLTIGSGQATFAAGTVAAPGITFNDDLDTGIYRGGGNRVSFSTAGVARASIDSSGTFEIGGEGSNLTANFIQNTSNVNYLEFGGGTTGNKITQQARGTDINVGISIQGKGSGDVLFNPSTTGNVGIGTTTPWRVLSVTGTVGFDGLTGATGAGSLCLDANKQVVYNSASDACLSSTRATKHDIPNLSLDGLTVVDRLQPVSFVYNQGDGRTRYGFIAEDTAAVDPRLATYDASSTISGIDARPILSIVVKAIQEQQDEFDALTGAASSTPAAQNFATAFFSNLFAKVTAWLADAANGIGDVFARAFHAKDEICIGDTCVNEDQLKALLAAQNVAQT